MKYLIKVSVFTALQEVFDFVQFTSLHIAMGACIGRSQHVRCIEDSSPRVIDGFDILIPRLPYNAWRLMMAFLQLDCAFSHCVVPTFHLNGNITVHLVSREPSYVRNLMLALEE